MRIELNCACCGNNKFTLSGDVADNAVVRCLNCGHHIGTMREVKERVAAEVLKRAQVDPAG